MSVFSKFRDQSVAVYGLAPSGLAVVRQLVAAGAHIYAWDEREARRAEMTDVSVRLCPPEEWPWDHLCRLVPGHLHRFGLSIDNPVFVNAASHGVPVKSDLDILAETLGEDEAGETQLVLVTGSHGKSLSAEMMAHCLRANGREVWLVDGESAPALGQCSEAWPDFIIAAASFRQLAFSKAARPDASILLNMLKSDSRFFQTTEQCVEAAFGAFRNMHGDEAIIIGTDDRAGQKICTALTSRIAQQTGDSENIVPVSGEATLGLGIFSVEGHVFDARYEKSVAIGALAGSADWGSAVLNLAGSASIACLLQLGLAPATILRALQTWPGRRGCQQIVARREGLILVDDSDARDLHATAAALSRHDRVIWVGGGDVGPKDYRLVRHLGDRLIGAHLFGRAGRRGSAELRNGHRVSVTKTAGEAVREALEAAHDFLAQDDGAGPIAVVLSPGAQLRDRASLRGVLLRASDDIAEEAAA